MGMNHSWLHPHLPRPVVRKNITLSPISKRLQMSPTDAQYYYCALREKLKTLLFKIMRAVALFPLLLLLPGALGLKCFTCTYDADVTSPSELASPTSEASHCLKDSPPLRLLIPCDDAQGPRRGTTLCENSTLVENGKVVALSRGCIERFGGSGTGGCALSKDDGFLTCICGEDGCNVAFLDTAYDAVVDKKESGGRGGAGLKLHDHQEKTDEDVEGQRPRHGSNKHKHDDGQGGAGRGRVWGWGWPGIALVLIR